MLGKVVGRDEIWKVGEWAYYCQLPGTVQIKEVSFANWYVKATYLVEFQGRQFWAFHSELE